MGGGLPRRYSGWVLRDLTRRTWVVRHLLRALVQVAPVVVVLLLVIPGTWYVRAAAVLAGLLLGLLYSGAYLYEISEHRARKAGFPVGTARLLRERANADKRRAEAERYARTWRRPADEGGGPHQRQQDTTAATTCAERASCPDDAETS
ncbi:MAG: DUF5313 family protein [Pseudonocardia sp.]|nr:DUF5313 family protein [Pseudonocardia sp.]